VTWSWVAFFVAMAVANWYVAFHFPTDTWVNFKVWGRHRAGPRVRRGAGALWLARHMQDPTEPAPPRP
jgi:intracellular septation protein